MARRRVIDPGFWENEEVLALSDAAVRCAIGSWGICDRNGVFPWRPRKWVHKFSPKSTEDPDQVFQELIDVGFVARFEVGAEHFGFWLKWTKHQDPHIDEAPQFPMPVGDPRFTPCMPRSVTKRNAGWMAKFYSSSPNVGTSCGTGPETVPPLVLTQCRHSAATGADPGGDTIGAPSCPSLQDGRPTKKSLIQGAQAEGRCSNHEPVEAKATSAFSPTVDPYTQTRCEVQSLGDPSEWEGLEPPPMLDQEAEHTHGWH